MFGIMVADYYVVKRQHIVLNDLYTMSPNGTLHFESGWNTRALLALAGSAAVSIGLSLAGAYGAITNVGDWGWLIGAVLGALFYTALMRGREAPVERILPSRST
jgi:nucleobase:cation symporter-1, NCS1 family